MPSSRLPWLAELLAQASLPLNSAEVSKLLHEPLLRETSALKQQLQQSSLSHDTSLHALTAARDQWFAELSKTRNQLSTLQKEHDTLKQAHAELQNAHQKLQAASSESPSLTAWPLHPSPKTRVAIRELPKAFARYIPSGDFLMGSDSSDPFAFFDEGPRHSVYLTQGIWILETPVTQEQFLALQGYNPSCFQHHPPSPVSLRSPVESLSWHEAAAFANALSRLQHLPHAFSATPSMEYKALLPPTRGWRLPTEAEWEYACRAGTTTPRYASPETLGWSDSDSNGRTSPVGQKAANPWGLCDMLGNVWEWCLDWYELYDPPPNGVDPSGPAFGSKRVIRGASWANKPFMLRASQRGSLPPSEASPAVGFRLVRFL